MTSLAEEVLSKLRLAAALAEGRRLPTIRALAASWEVSPRTVQLAVHEAVRQGWLETRPGSGIWPRGARPRPSPPALRMDAERLAESIATDIQTGKLAAGGSLSPPKDYSNLHGIHPSTVRKAFAILQGQGLVERRGRSWAASRPRLGTPSRAPVLWCIGASDADGNLRMESDREWDFWRGIQAEAIRCGLRPRLIPWRGALPGLSEDVLGAIVSTWHLIDSSQLLDAVLRARLPAAVWAANHEGLPGKRYRLARGMWFHELAFGRGAGLAMAGYLAGLDHAKVAWVSPFQASPWARNRLDGLREGLPPEVELVEANGEWTSEWDIQDGVLADPASLSRVRLEGIDHGGATDPLRRPVIEAVTRDRALAIFGPRLEEAWSSGATLWVAASDLVARWCLHWLRARGHETPRDIALASFDDTRDASRLNLTSLRFDVQGMVRAMVRQVLSRREPHRLFTHYDGLVVERASTAQDARRVPAMHPSTRPA